MFLKAVACLFFAEVLKSCTAFPVIRLPVRIMHFFFISVGCAPHGMAELFSLINDSNFKRP